MLCIFILVGILLLYLAFESALGFHLDFEVLYLNYSFLAKET